MLFGYNNDKIRTRPSYSGQRAICPLCGGALIGKCGEIYVEHWQHKRDTNCDPWKEHESYWHRKWKAKFPDAWQEIIIEKYGEKHIADVKTNDDLIIEFQNSSISPATIRKRESFYEDMIWLVNAVSFKDNFSLRSVVSSRLHSIDKSISNQLASLQFYYNDLLKTMNDKVEESKKNSTAKLTSVNHKKQTLIKLKEIYEKFDEFSNSAIDKWCKKDFYSDYNTSAITNKIDSAQKEVLNKIYIEIEKLTAIINIDKHNLNSINAFENFIVEEKAYKIVGYELISSKSFSKVKAVLKSSLLTFFPEIISFKSEAEFQSYQYKKGSYDFIYNPSERISTLSMQIAEGEATLATLTTSLTNLRKEITNDLWEEFNKYLSAVEQEIAKLNTEWLESNTQVNSDIIKQTELNNLKAEELASSTAQIKKDNSQRRYQVMMEQKGRYTFDWKHERKSWQSARSPIYFDIGENYLFEKVDDEIFKKVLIEEFLKRHLKNSHS